METTKKIKVREKKSGRHDGGNNKEDNGDGDGRVKEMIVRKTMKRMLLRKEGNEKREIYRTQKS